MSGMISNCAVLSVLLLAACADAFMVPPSLRVAPIMSLMEDGAATPVDAGKTADRALDSALDFLQDGEAEAEEEEEEEDEFEMFDIFDDSPDLEINYDLISELGKKDLEFLANKGVPAAVAQQAVIDAAIKKWQKHDNDVGSAEVQVAIAHHRIKYLTAHLIENKKDVATKRGLQALVVQRKKFLSYLYKTNPEKAEAMVSELGIRFRGNVASWDKNSKYGAYKNTKSKWEKIRAEKRVEAATRKGKTLCPGINV